MEERKVILNHIALRDENILFENCPDCSTELSANLIEDVQSIEIIRDILKKFSPEDTKDLVFELKDGTLLMFFCKKCFPGVAVKD